MGNTFLKTCNIFCWYFQALPMRFVVKLWTSTIITLQGAIYLQFYSGRCLAMSSCNHLPPEFLLSPRCVIWTYAQITLWGGLKTFPCEACWADGCKKWFIGYLHFYRLNNFLLKTFPCIYPLGSSCISFPPTDIGFWNISAAGISLSVHFGPWELTHWIISSTL